MLFSFYDLNLFSCIGLVIINSEFIGPLIVHIILIFLRPYFALLVYFHFQSQTSVLGYCIHIFLCVGLLPTSCLH
jgi:hypothetical protein